MFIKNKSGLLQSRLLLQYKEIRHGFSTRKMGDGRKVIGKEGLYFAAQVHGNKVEFVSQQLITPNTDGILARRGSIAVRTADCVPLLFFDPVEKIIGAVHAGWKGTIKNIAHNAVVEMGSNPKNIVVCIGPHIGMCHYDVPEDRAKLFVETFNNNDLVVNARENKWYLDIGYANFLQLQQAGISKDHIDIPVACTYCQQDDFFSYRRDTKESFGEMIGTISYV